MIFEGKWQVIITTPIGKQSVLLDIIMEDGIFKGTATQGNETVNFEEIVAVDNRLNWWQSVTKPLRLRLKFEVVVDDDQMTGTAKAAMFPASKLVGARSVNTSKI